MPHPPRIPGSFGDADTLAGVEPEKYARLDKFASFEEGVEIQQTVGDDLLFQQFKLLAANDFSSSVDLDFGLASAYRARSSDSSVTFTTSNLEDRWCFLFIENLSGGVQTYTFPSWNWSTPVPASLPASGKQIIVLHSTTDADSGVIAGAFLTTEQLASAMEEQIALDDLSDVAVTEPGPLSHIVVGTGSGWTNVLGTALYIGVGSNIAALGDVSGGAAAYDVLRRNSANSAYEPKSLTECNPRGQYFKTSGTNQTSSSTTPVPITFLTSGDTEYEDASAFGQDHSGGSPEEITCNEDGDVEITFKINGESNDMGTRNVAAAVVEHEPAAGGGFTAIAQTLAYGYSRNNDDDWTAVCPGVTYTVANGDKLRLSFYRHSGGGQIVCDFSSDGTALLKLRYEKITT